MTRSEGRFWSLTSRNCLLQLSRQTANLKYYVSKILVYPDLPLQVQHLRKDFEFAGAFSRNKIIYLFTYFLPSNFVFLLEKRKKTFTSSSNQPLTKWIFFSKGQICNNLEMLTARYFNNISWGILVIGQIKHVGQFLYLMEILKLKWNINTVTVKDTFFK